MPVAELEAKLETKMEAAEAGKETLYLGEAIEFFLKSKRSGGRSEKTMDDYRKKLELFQRQENPDQARELAELMGHSDLSQVMKYALSDEKRARAGVAKL